jgi:hypothetical protein
VADWRRIAVLACRFSNERYRDILTFPWPEVMRIVKAGQDIEEDDGAGAQIGLLRDLIARLGGAYG